MFTYKKENFNVPIKAWLKEEEYFCDNKVVEQTENLARLPFVFHHVALSPDAHSGFGMPIGGIIATNGFVIPYAVGSDIGCGMCAVKTSLTNIDSTTLKKIMGDIRRVIPVGFNKNIVPYFERMPWYEKENCPITYRENTNASLSLGTLGGGNHFIEIQKGSDGFIWIMIHSGSRNLGKQVCDHYNHLAEEIGLISPSHKLSPLLVDSVEGKLYLNEMNYCVEYALANRQLMMEKICNCFVSNINDRYVLFEPMINIAHNYASLENHFGQEVLVHRKGATLATKDTIGIIPGSQGSKSYIVKGKGNPESFMSCSHGAGRRMGREEAKRILSLEEEVKRLDEMGVLHSVRGVGNLDEAPSAYKNIDTVMENQKDLVDVLVELTPLAVIKG